MRKLIFVSSPYSHPDDNVREENYQKVSKYTAELINNGVVAFSPILYGHTALNFQPDNGSINQYTIFIFVFIFFNIIHIEYPIFIIREYSNNNLFTSIYILDKFFLKIAIFFFIICYISI